MKSDFAIGSAVIGTLGYLTLIGAIVALSLTAAAWLFINHNEASAVPVEAA